MEILRYAAARRALVRSEGWTTSTGSGQQADLPLAQPVPPGGVIEDAATGAA
jgi:hypothetical protein